MALVLRLCRSNLANGLGSNPHKYGVFTGIRTVSLQPQPYKQPLELSHDERNAKLGRPQSPHLTIYAPQLTSMLSISHRGTGMVLTGYVVLFTVGTWLPADTIPNYLDALAAAKVGAPLIIASKFSLAFPFCYHFWNGIRHLFWDMGKFLTIKEVYTTGYIMLLATIGSSIALSLI